MDWNDQLSVSVEALDADHKQLIEIVNELYDRILDNSTRDLLDGTFERLAKYTQIHFAHEEEFFELTHYPDTDSHRRKHEEMTSWVLETQRKLKSGELPAPPMQVALYLKQWLLHHIIGTDNKYKAHLNESGIY